MPDIEPAVDGAGLGVCAEAWDAAAPTRPNDNATTDKAKTRARIRGFLPTKGRLQTPPTRAAAPPRFNQNWNRSKIEPAGAGRRVPPETDQPPPKETLMRTRMILLAP